MHALLLPWFDAHARDLPWRRPGTTPWGVLVSELMLQQTPVVRVEPVWTQWLARWPTPSALAAASRAEVLRAWGKLGYPRRALRLHSAAVAIADQYHDVVPAEVDELEALPGVGIYTARAVAAFGYGRRCPVVDTNVRRVVARAVHGAAEPGPARTAADLVDVEALLPPPDTPDGTRDRAAAAPMIAVSAQERQDLVGSGAQTPILTVRLSTAVRFSAALMELGAVVCTARAPRCGSCPLQDVCAWQLAGRPAHTGSVRTPQAFAGTDRQVRGRLLDVLRDSPGPVPRAALDAAWSDAAQRDRCLASLLADGLVSALAAGRFGLPDDG